jgi:hypothetical protein
MGIGGLNLVGTIVSVLLIYIGSHFKKKSLHGWHSQKHMKKPLPKPVVPNGMTAPPPPTRTTPDQEEREWRQIFGKLPTYQQTKLNPQQEIEFQNWFKGLPWYAQMTKDTGQMPNMNDPMYDYRGAFAAKMGPDETGHWRSVNPETGRPLKNPKHDTWWKEEFVTQQGGANTDQPNQEVIDMVDKFQNRGEALAYLRSLGTVVR